MQRVDRSLEHGEGLIHHVALLQYELREFILLAVDPQVGEGLLGAVENLNQVVEGRRHRVVVENSVRRCEVLSVVSRSTLQERESKELLEAL